MKGRATLITATIAAMIGLLLGEFVVTAVMFDLIGVSLPSGSKHDLIWYALIVIVPVSFSVLAFWCTLKLFSRK
jgi:hypothetical protein